MFLSFSPKCIKFYVDASNANSSFACSSGESSEVVINL